MDPSQLAGARKRKVMVVDDHPVFRRGVAGLIDETEDLEVCAEVGGRAEAREALEGAAPDVAIVDLTLGGESGLDLVRELRSRSPAIPALVLSFHEERLYGERSMRAGARGYLTKEAPADEILDAIRVVLHGGTHFGEELSKRVAEEGGLGVDVGVDSLTNRELQVLELLGKGMGTRDIAEALELSIKTIETHRQHIKQKLGLAKGPELVHYAIKWLEERHGA